MASPASTATYQLRMRGFDSRIVERAGSYVAAYAKALNLEHSHVRLPRRIRRFSALKSPFKFHKHWDHFEWRVHSRVVTLKGVGLETERHIGIIKDELPAGVNLRVECERTFRMPLPAEGAVAAAPGALPVDGGAIPLVRIKRLADEWKRGLTLVD